MKKRVLILALLLCLTLAFGALAETITTETKDYRNLADEGTVVLGDGYSFEIRYCGPEGARVFGRVYYPEGFDSGKKNVMCIAAMPPVR